MTSLDFAHSYVLRRSGVYSMGRRGHDLNHHDISVRDQARSIYTSKATRGYTIFVFIPRKPIQLDHIRSFGRFGLLSQLVAT